MVFGLFPGQKCPHVGQNTKMGALSRLLGLHASPGVIQGSLSIRSKLFAAGLSTLPPVPSEVSRDLNCS